MSFLFLRNFFFVRIYDNIDKSKIHVKTSEDGMGEDDFEEELRKNLSKEIKENFSDEISGDFSDEDEKKKHHRFSDRYQDDYDLVTDISGDDHGKPGRAGLGVLKLVITIGASAAIAIIVLVLLVVNGSYNCTGCICV